MYIDLSHWNVVKDWEKVAQNVQGVILKCGGTDSKNGNAYTDSCFEKYYNECKAHNIPVGCYWFVGNNCYTSAEGILNALECLKRLEGKQFELPIFIDFETSKPSLKRGNTNAVISFCNCLENKGYFVGVYASDISGFDERLYYDDLKTYFLWIAKYSDKEPKHKYNLWQYTSTATIEGIDGNVDCSRDKDNYLGKIKNIIMSRGFNGFIKDINQPLTPVTIYTHDYFRIYEKFDKDMLFADKLKEVLDEWEK